ncbi:hypothetical protein ABZ611_23290 [Streptomyces sp. NPDC007861]|uniref:hypothetical protein n=1 Tax=Streptomyces sp. NPDC007861 TaxID=3154893 RepID=UPI0033C03146
MLPDNDPSNWSEPTPEQLASAYAAAVEKRTVADDDPAPMWQSDHGPAPTNFNPYVVNGVDISSQSVTPYDSGTCYWLAVTEARHTAYTTVGEAHANWDSYGTFEYDNKLSTTFDVAMSQGSNWKTSGSVALSKSTGINTGYTNGGPYFAKQ